MCIFEDYITNKPCYTVPVEKKKISGPLNILITAGGASEKIDDVRRITNSATGALGAKIADAFAACGRECNIVYICPENAVRPAAKPKQVIVANDVNAVEDAVRRSCAETVFDVVVHSMAIGDYRIRAVSDADMMTGGVLENLSVLVCGDSSSPEEAVRDAILSPPVIREAKISSDRDNLVLVLEKAPKIIALYRGLLPEAVIVGFKLLSGAGDEELVNVGHALLVKNDCDFVLANDMRTIRAVHADGRDQHEGLLIDREGNYKRAGGKEGIALLIVESVLGLFCP